MKNFDQLTESQKETALLQAKRELTDLVQLGIIDFGPGDGVTNKQIEHYAIAAAEGSLYSEAGDRIIDGIA